jgi:acetyl esterase/lipase
MKNYLLLIIIIFELGISGHAQNPIQYKKIDTINLYMNMYVPEKIDSLKTHPAMVFFFGGGWITGSIKQFEPHAKYFSDRGLICFLVDYRIKSRHNTGPVESLEDAKSAIRFIRQNASGLFVDTSKIIAAGGSAGGHLAAATALINDYNEMNENQKVNCKPNALVLFNPAIDNGPGGYGYERLGEQFKNFSPLHNIRKGAPPTILFLGTNDHIIPVETAKYYKVIMEKVGSRCDLILYEGEKHGFFNYKNFDNFNKTVYETDKFLISLGYLSGEPMIKFSE